MAPDLNSVSRPSNQLHVSDHASTNIPTARDSPGASRRTSSAMGPPPLPQNSSLPTSPRPPAAAAAAAAENAAFSASAGPIRHPRPLTAAELHLELEKEQESIVNRLTRELSALRAQTASVASTASSTSDLFTSNQNEPYMYSYNAPNIIPTSARRHRSSSNLSSRSARSTRDALSSSAAGATSVSGVAAPRDRDREREYGVHPTQSHQTSSRPSIEIPRPEMSRQNSMSGVHRAVSGTAPPSATSPHWAHTSHPRHSVSSSIGGGGEVYMRSPSASMTSINAQARYEEAAMQRAELDAVKKENEALKTKIRELERSLADKNSAASRSDHESSTATTDGSAGTSTVAS